jgi:hypothetical protein
MKDETASFLFGIFCGIGIACVVLSVAGLNPKQMQEKSVKEAIAHGAAHYEVDTNGVVSFKWNK